MTIQAIRHTLKDVRITINGKKFYMLDRTNYRPDLGSWIVVVKKLRGRHND